MARNLLHKNKYHEFVDWLKSKKIEYRPGKGQWQLLQVKTERYGWQCIFTSLHTTEHLSVNRKLEPIVRQFIEECNGR